jgi:hypothetical protein
MVTPNDPLIRDLVEWVAREPRTYADVMDAWRTSCPRLTIWEDAIDRGFLVRQSGNGQKALVSVTEGGRRFLQETRQAPAAALQRRAPAHSS